MSVINKMLRDLDARRADGAVPDYPRQASPAAMQGTASVVTSAQRRSSAPWLLAVLLLLTAGAAVYWRLEPGAPAVPTPAPAELPASPPMPAASAPEPVASAAVEPAIAVSEGAAVVPVEPVAAAEPVVGRKKKRRAEADEAEAKISAAAERKERLRKERISSSIPDPVTPAPATAKTEAAALLPSATASASATSLALQRRQSLAQETLAQVQLLWNAGSREPALELVREAVTAVERSQPVDAPLLAQLVREQVRMELVQGRPAAVLSLLGRLEPVLSGQADLWAVRGNAAQRLGRHQEAVQAYLAALQLRTGEPRWMLGAAVSLAALGQLDAAARQAEQARALGPVSPEVLAYLRQAGVLLR
ncbi:MAG: hypothetical protein KGL73_08070 [Burkholderiales bacterium]|nr:hypothetical protein [Burkholderiales bacterium]